MIVQLSCTCIQLQIYINGHILGFMTLTGITLLHCINIFINFLNSRYRFPHVVNRMGKMEVVDTRLFCVAAMSFYNQLTDDAQLRAFVSTFQMVISLGAPYTQLLELLSDSKK